MMRSSPHRRAAKTQLDATVVGIELTLISIIQGLALGVLAASAVRPMVQLQWETWPYIATGLATILVFWSRSLMHTLRSSAGRWNSGTPSCISPPR